MWRQYYQAVTARPQPVRCLFQIHASQPFQTGLPQAGRNAGNNKLEGRKQSTVMHCEAACGFLFQSHLLWCSCLHCVTHNLFLLFMSHNKLQFLSRNVSIIIWVKLFRELVGVHKNGMSCHCFQHLH